MTVTYGLGVYSDPIEIPTDIDDEGSETLDSTRRGRKRSFKLSLDPSRKVNYLIQLFFALNNLHSLETPVRFFWSSNSFKFETYGIRP